MKTFLVLLSLAVSCISLGIRADAADFTEGESTTPAFNAPIVAIAEGEWTTETTEETIEAVTEETTEGEVSPPGEFFDTYYWYNVENGEATIVWANPYNGNVTIPSELGGYPVAVIGENAYDGVGLTGNISIPDSVRKIEARAFANAYINGDIILFQGLEEIGEDAFKDAHISSVYFAGTEREFSKIDIAPGNDCIIQAEKLYKYDLSTHLFESAFYTALGGAGSAGSTMLMGPLAPLIFLVIPPAGAAALFAPILSVQIFLESMIDSFILFISSIAVLFV